MIEFVIRWSIANRFLVVLGSILLAAAGTIAVLRAPLDAIPDLSDVQVIVKTTYPGQAPQVIEDQVTYPLATAMLAVPGAKTVRGYSFFNDSFVYVIFEDGTDLYWARSRVLEYLSQIAPRLPEAASPALGPDATGVGWVYQYALIDRTGRHDLAELRSLQDWFLKYELQTVEGVSEVATIGGMVRQYQAVVDPEALRAFNIPLSKVAAAIRSGNRETGGRVVEMAEAEYMIRATGYIDDLDDLRRIPVALAEGGRPILLDEVAEIRFGPDMRRGIGELNGEGEAVGGVVIMRFGGNALATIERVKERIEEIKSGLPAGVELVETYDRSALIERAVANLNEKLIEEFIIVVAVCAAFLFHLRSALVVILFLPLGVGAAFIVMNAQGINANIMSLGGIAIAVGAMVDAAIVMIENVHKHAEKTPLSRENRWQVVGHAAAEVGPALFFSLLVITLSFLPIFALEAQEGRMFAPLAFTKTYAMAAAALLSITLVPVLMGLFIRGRIRSEEKNPLNRALMALYRPLAAFAIRRPWPTLGLALLAMLSMAYPLSRIGSEFMPDLDEGDLLYMPSAYPAISGGKMAEVLQQTDKLIKQIPEVESVHGKAGRAESATDPAPMMMVETTIRLKPREDWRPGVTLDDIKRELDRAVQVPSLVNVWTMPIKNRIDMLATGIKTPVGVKVAGPDLKTIGGVTEKIEAVLKGVPGTASAYAERVTGGRYVEIDVDRLAAARHGLSIEDVHMVVETAIGGMAVTESVEGLERYSVNIRYPEDVRNSVAALKALPVVTERGAQIPLGALADISVKDGPGIIRSENARLSGWIFVDVTTSDIGAYVAEAKRVVAEKVDLPPGYSVAWSGQFEFMERAKARLAFVIPATLALVFVLLYLSFRRLMPVIIVMASLPLSLVGGFWLLEFLGYNLSVAVAVGMIALAGVAAETGVVMLIYLDLALVERKAKAAEAGRALTLKDLAEATMDGAVKRLRPKLMTVSVIVAGLLPIMLGSGTGSEVMRRIAAPMVGGMASATLLTLLVIPAAFVLWQRWLLARRR